MAASFFRPRCVLHQLVLPGVLIIWLCFRESVRSKLNGSYFCQIWFGYHFVLIQIGTKVRIGFIKPSVAGKNRPLTRSFSIRFELVTTHLAKCASSFCYVVYSKQRQSRWHILRGNVYDNSQLDTTSLILTSCANVPIESNYRLQHGGVSANCHPFQRTRAAERPLTRAALYTLQSQRNPEKSYLICKARKGKKCKCFYKLLKRVYMFSNVLFSY